MDMPVWWTGAMHDMTELNAVLSIEAGVQCPDRHDALATVPLSKHRHDASTKQIQRV